MTKKILNEEKIYELALEEKKHEEQRRDDINAHYISLFAAIIAIAPFINNIVDAVPGRYEGLVVRASLIILSSIGLILAIIWSANLKRTLFIIEYLDEIVLALEKKHDIRFKVELFNHLDKKGSPDRVTKYQLLMPQMFIIIFSVIIIYSISWLIIK